MLETIKNAWKIPDLRKKILFTLMMLLVFRLGSHILVPYIDKEVLSSFIEGNSMLGLLNVISGNNLQQFTIFAMGISPYITASIIMNLLTIAIPALERLQKEGEAGQKKIAKYTRYAALFLAIIQSLGVILTIESILEVDTWYVKTFVIMILTAGTCFLLWMGEAITEKGIGNGISMLIFIGIISSFPQSIISAGVGIVDGTFPLYIAIGLIIFSFLSVMGVVAVQEGARKIPVQYAKRVVGRKVYGGRNSHLPLKVNQTGVIPIIFASTLTMFPSTLASFFPNVNWLASLSEFMAWGRAFPTILYVILIVAFTFFYTMVTFNPVDVANNIQQNGGFIPGIRPGYSTIMYLKKILNRLTMSGGIYLAIVAIIPIIAGNLLKINLQFAGTSLLIAVGVALETVKQLEQEMVVRNYKGFLK